MQPINKVLQGQTFVDMVCQQAGSYQEIINAAIQNDLSITADVVIGQIINVKNIADSDVVEILKNKRPASQIAVSETENNPEGISIWAVDKDFIVNG